MAKTFWATVQQYVMLMRHVSESQLRVKLAVLSNSIARQRLEPRPGVAIKCWRLDSVTQ